MKKMYSLLLSMTFCLVLSSSSWATDYYVDAARPDDSGNGLTPLTAKKTIQAAVTAASAGDVVIVTAGTYVENVSINKALTLRSTSGRVSTIITGITNGALGTILIQAANITIGGFGQGFTINGIDNPSPGLESAAIYIQGARNDVTIRGNDIVANGEAGLLTEFNQAVNNLVVNANIFSGKTFTGVEAGDCGFGNQFTAANVPRQLVNIPTGTGITFTSNNITGTAGSTSSIPACATFGQGNTLVTIDANNATIRGNTFAGTTTRFGSSLRVRGTGANITCNAFDNTGLGAACTHIVLNATSLGALGSPNSLAGIASQNTFNDGAYFTGAVQIYRDAAQVNAIPQTPIPVNTTVLANVTNTNTGEKFCSIQSAIDDANTANGHTITVAAGTYNEQVLVNKSLTVKGIGVTKPIIDFTGIVSGKPTLFDVSADATTIENLNFKVDLSKLKSAIIASGASIDNIVVKDNLIEGYGTPSTGTYSDRNAVSINYGGNTDYRVAAGGVNSITFQNNTVSGTGPSSYFRSGVSVDEGGGTFSGNTLQTINHDILVRFGRNGAVNITNNNFNGGGVELSDQNAAAGTFTVSGNTFNATFANVAAPGAAVLRLKNNYNSIPHTISSNTFTNFDWAMSLENMNTVTLNANTFTGLNPTSRAVVFNTKSISSNSNTIFQVPVALTMTNNAFSGTGTALSFLNHDSDNDSYGTFTIGTAGNENSFASTLSNFIFLDGQTGSSNGSTFPTYPNTGGWPTTMACWDQNLDIKNNKFDVGAGLQLPQSMNLTQRTSLEGKLDHKPDLACKGSLQFFLPVHNVTQNTYYSTIQAGVTAANANDIIECSEWTYNESVTIDKSLTLQGINTDKSLQVINGTGISLAMETGGITLASGVTNVTIKNFTIQNFTGASGNLNAGIYGVGGNNNLTVTNVALLNNPTASGFYANGPVSNVSITNSTVSNHVTGARGIVIWNGFKQGITITNNNLSNNNCCGIELQEGTASNVNVSGNTIDIGVGDNAIGITGLNNSVGPNLINNNIITGGGRFGIEIKNPAGGVTVSGNSVTLTTQNADVRDRAGIAVLRRVVQPGNVDVPNGVTITGNTVTGYQQSSTSEGFGIVIEGTNHTVTGNTLNNNEVGILQQQNPSNYPGDADQSNLADQYFGRGNSPITCGNTISGNTFSGNTTDDRNIGVGAGLVTNTNTNEYFCSIQAAINDADTQNGHTITVAAGTYNESISINKSLIIKGAQADVCAATTRAGSESIINCVNGIGITADNVTINGFTIQGQTTNAGPGFGYAVYMAPPRAGTQLLNNIIKNNRVGSSLANTGASQAIIKCNWFDANNNAGAASGNGIYTDEYTGGGVISNVLIENNKFSGHTSAGITISTSQAALATTGITITKNEFSGNARAAFLYNTVSSSFINNVISGSTRTDGTGDLRIFGGVNNLSVMNNSFSAGGPRGILITNDGAQVPATNSNITITQNSFTGYNSTNFAIANVSGYTGAVPATCNWYGGTGASVPPLISGSVTFEPFLTNGTDNDAAIGFQPVPNSCSGCTSFLPTITATETSGTTNNDGTICNGASVTLTASTGSGFSHLWNTTATTEAITVAPSTTTPYTVTVTNANGCSATANTTVTVNTLSTAPTAITGTTTICAGGSTTLTLTGGSAGTGANAEWFTGSCGGTPAGTGNSITVSPSNTTTYFVRYNGTCNTTTCASTTVTVNTLSTAPTAITGTTTICAGGSTTLTIAGGSAGTGANAEWFTGSCGGTPAGTGNSIMVSPSNTTTYFVRYNGTCNTTTCASTTVTVNTLSTAPTAITGTTTICAGGSTTLTLAGGSAGTGANAEWFTGSCGGTPAGTGNSIMVSPSNTTTYFVRYNGTCNTTTCANTTVTVNTLSTAPTAITGTTTICAGGSTTLTLTGGSAGTGANAEWFTGTCGGTPVGTGNSIMVSPSNTTTYFVRYKGTCNTTTCANTTVTVNPLPTASISGTTQVCQNAPFPTITFTGSNGTAPYTFTYKINGGADLTITTSSGNSVSLNQTTATAGTFVYSLLSVKDASSTQCSQSQSGSTTITVNPLPVLSFTGPNPVCQGSNSALSANLPGAWTANDPSKATIDPDGTINALTPGTATFKFTVAGTGCQATTSPLTIKPTPTSALTASKYDVCPNTPVTLNPNCSIPTSTVQWNPGAPTVTPDAATVPYYVYKASCTADGCTGKESSIEVRTHRILVDMKDLDVGVLPLPIVRSVIDNMAPTNQVNAPVFPRRWTFIANGCDASESAVFKLSGPVNFNTIDNAGVYAMFANDGPGGNLFYSIDHPNYGNGGSFPNGTYTLTIDLRSQDGVGGPFPKNRVAVGSLLATRTLQFTVGNPLSALSGRQSAVEADLFAAGSEQWAVVIPNPVSNIMRLKVTDAKGQKVNVILLDASGRTMLKRDFMPETNQHQEEFNIGDITNGMYFLRVNTADKNATLKVVKVE